MSSTQSDETISWVRYTLFHIRWVGIDRYTINVHGRQIKNYEMELSMYMMRIELGFTMEHVRFIRESLTQPSITLQMLRLP